jgi:hypothetical protein
MSEFVTNIRGSQAMGHYDLARISEQLIKGLLGPLLDLRKLRDLNQEAKNFPGIDLADDEKRVAIQVTATTTLEKVKSTIETFVAHKLHEKYDRLVIYVLTERQNSYSQNAIDAATDGRFSFSATADILDYQNLLSHAATCSPPDVHQALEVFRSFNRGGKPAGISEADFDPPSGTEILQSNYVELYLPSVLFVADLVPEVKPKGKFMARKAVKAFANQLGKTLPSGFEIHNRQLITFHKLDSSLGVFNGIIDLGTVTTMESREYHQIDKNYLRIFKSLLRLTMQQKLYGHQVQWMYEDKLFAFMPSQDGDKVREITWRGDKEATRKVFERKANKSDASKDFAVKHLAFRLEFFLIESAWFMAITPDWYFSFGKDYARSRYSNDLLSWIKRAENNAQVMTHFRFLAAWLASLDNDDLFSEQGMAPTMSVGDAITIGGHPSLIDENWRPPRELNNEQGSPTGELFNL